MHFELSSKENNLQITDSLLTNHGSNNQATLLDNKIEEENKQNIPLNVRMLYLSKEFTK